MYLSRSKKIHISSQVNGYSTVFLSLSIMIILSLILALFQGARIGAVKMKTECVADISMNSILAEYNRELFKQYSLLMVETSYGSGNHSITNTEEHLKNYAQKNFTRSLEGRIRRAQTMTSIYCKDARITGTSYATDNGGAVLNRQILEYMKAEPLEHAIFEAQENTKKLTESGFDTTDVEEMARANQEEIDSIELPTIINEDGEEEEVSLANPADQVNSQKGVGVLNLASSGRIHISEAYANLNEYCSYRAKNKGTGLNDRLELSAVDRLLLEEYYFEKCSRYGKELEKSLLKYQLEYLVYGESSDWRNLEKFAETLLFWREASNLAYILTCQSKISAAEAAAAALAAVCFAPELKDPVKYSILFAWTFAESISDIAILLEGGRVPLFKSDDTWQLGFWEMLSFRNNLGKRDCGSGLYYKDYLRMRLLMTSHEDKTKRLMDVIEMDVRLTPGNGSFKLDHCLDTFCGEISVGTSYGYDTKIERVYGYEE